jgi:hypothetical protein
LKFKKSHVNSNSSKATYKDFLEYLGSSLCNVWLFVFWVLDKLYFCNFLISNLFSTIVSVSDEPRGGLQLLLGHQKHQSPPLGSSLRWKLKCLVTSWSPLNLGLLISWSLRISPKIQISLFLAKCEKMVNLFIAPQKLIFRAYHPTPKYLSSTHFIHPSLKKKKKKIPPTKEKSIFHLNLEIKIYFF